MNKAREVEIRRLLKQGNTFVVGTSGILAYLNGEKEAELFSLIKHASAILFVVMTELYYLTWQKVGKTSADEVYGLVKAWNIPVLLPEERVMSTAGRYKAVYGPGIADSYIAAFAGVGHSVLFTKDPDYRIFKREIRIFQFKD